MATPTQLILQNGTRANDGTGDTLRDATTKINDNFTNLWNDLYNGTEQAPGREFQCRGIGGTSPDSGGFTIQKEDLATDSDQYVRISFSDRDGKRFKTSSTATIDGTRLSMWQLDTGSVDNWTLVALYEGTITYEPATKHWRFSRDSDGSLLTVGSVDSTGTYYLSVQGLW